MQYAIQNLERKFPNFPESTPVWTRLVQGMYGFGCQPDPSGPHILRDCAMSPLKNLITYVRLCWIWGWDSPHVPVFTQTTPLSEGHTVRYWSWVQWYCPSRRMKMLLVLVEVHTLVENRSPSCGLALSAQRCLPMGPTIKHHDRMLSIELWSKKNFKKFGRHFEDKTSKQHYLIGLLNLSHWSDPIYTFIY